MLVSRVFFFFQAEDGIRDGRVTGVQTCALPISRSTAAAPTPRWAGTARAGRTRSVHPGRASGASAARASGGSRGSSTASGRRRARSEERRAGKECRSRWWPHHEKKKKERDERTA